MLINLPDPLNFLVRSLTHEFYVQNWSWSKKGGMQKGGLVYWVSKIFWSWSKKREMRKGGWVRKGWVRSSSAPGCEKKFSGASRPHPPKKNPVYAPVCIITLFSCALPSENFRPKKLLNPNLNRSVLPAPSVNDASVMTRSFHSVWRFIKRYADARSLTTPQKRQRSWQKLARFKFG